MDEQSRKAGATVTALLIAFGGATLGVTLASAPAQASSTRMMTGWTCYGTDACHQGTRECCTDDFGGSGHCSTYCPIN